MLKEAENSSNDSTLEKISIAHKVVFSKDEAVPLTKSEISKRFTALYDQLYPYAYFIASKFLLSADIADIVSGVFAKVWQQQKQFANLIHAKAYIRICIKNACLTQLRTASNRNRRETHYYLETVDDRGDQGFLEETAAENLFRIYKAMETLPEKRRMVFKMAFVDQMTNSEIAQKLKLNITTIKSHKMAALRQLRMTLLSWLILLIPVCIQVIQGNKIFILF